MSDFRRFVVAFDSHGSLIDPSAEKAFFEFIDLWKPQIRIGGGDHFDNAPLRRGASEDEKRQSMLSDFSSGMEFLRRFRPNSITWGNHDVRFEDIAKAGRGPISDFAQEKQAEIDRFCAKINCRTFPYDSRDGILEIGHLKIVHGYAHGLTAARRMAQAYGSVLFGHIHAIHQASIEGLENRIGRACGCLCKLDMVYDRANLGKLVHRHGWPYGVVNIKTGDYFVFQAECVNGTWLFPTDYQVCKN